MWIHCRKKNEYPSTDTWNWNRCFVCWKGGEAAVRRAPNQRSTREKKILCNQFLNSISSQRQNIFNCIQSPSTKCRSSKIKWEKKNAFILCVVSLSGFFFKQFVCCFFFFIMPLLFASACPDLAHGCNIHFRHAADFVSFFFFFSFFCFAVTIHL